MSRRRSYHQDMFRDERFIALSARARVLLLGLGTVSDYADHFVWDDEALIEALPGLWHSTEIRELLDAGLISRSGFDGEVLFYFGFPRRRVSRWESLRSLVFRRDNFTCRYCGTRTGPLHCDHVVPVTRGGSSEPDNLATACRFCNLSKNDRLVTEWAR